MELEPHGRSKRSLVRRIVHTEKCSIITGKFSPLAIATTGFVSGFLGKRLVSSTHDCLIEIIFEFHLPIWSGIEEPRRGPCAEQALSEFYLELMQTQLTKANAVKWARTLVCSWRINKYLLLLSALIQTTGT